MEQKSNTTLMKAFKNSGEESLDFLENRLDKSESEIDTNCFNTVHSECILKNRLM